MIYLFYGADTFSLFEALRALKEAVGPQDVRDSNIIHLTGPDITIERLRNACHTVPFLAERRLVLVEGLLSQFQQAPRSSRRRASSPAPRAAPVDSTALLGVLKAIPPTTDVVFVDGALQRENALLEVLGPLARVRTFPSLRHAELKQWVRARSQPKGLSLTAEALDSLVSLTGPNLWAMDNELEKLALFCMGRPAEGKDIGRLVSSAKEANIFAAVDAVLEGNPSLGVNLVHRLMEEGQGATAILAMLARQVSHLIQAREMVAQGVTQSEIGKRLGLLSEYPLRKTLEQASRYPPKRLAALHRLILKADVAIKTGQLEEGLALDLLITEARPASG
ncbi:MAG: DNA polymerase III subunit delta [Chloroflexi bacterium]|nr:DNA polymerase III subunit delta [Chloroflexota bacterium]